jgi:hypothetical protein
MSSVSHSVSEPNDATPADLIEFRNWLHGVEADCYADEVPVMDDCDFDGPTEDDRVWWAAEVRHLEIQRENLLLCEPPLPQTLAGHDDRLASARRRLGMISMQVAEQIAYGR